jgi:hypothetical protein
MVFYTEIDGLATRYELVVEETKRSGSVIAAKEKGKGGNVEGRNWNGGYASAAL